jgi:hypothetical protein
MPKVTAVKCHSAKGGKMWVARCLRYVIAKVARIVGGTLPGSHVPSAHSPMGFGGITADGGLHGGRAESPTSPGLPAIRDRSVSVSNDLLGTRSLALRSSPPLARHFVTG